MKLIKILCFLIFLFGCSSLSAQEDASDAGFGTPFGPKYKEIDSAFTVQNSKTEIRAIKSDGKEFKIPCQTYSLSSELVITDVSVDTGYKELFFLAKKSGKELSLKPAFIVGYNYQKNTIQWGKQSYHGKGISCIVTSDHYIFRIQRFRNYDNFAFHKGTGQLAWNNEFELRNAIFSKKIAFNDFIDCIDLSTGQIRWSRKLDNDYGWLEEILLNDEVMLTMVDGVHSLNLTDGSGWDYHAKTGKDESGERAGQVLGAAIAGLAFGSGSIQTDYLEKDAKKHKFPEMKSHAINASAAYTRAGLASNIKVEGNRLYFSAMDKFLCIDLITGKKIWEARLPDPRSGMAFIDLTADKVLFINKGCGYRNKALSSYFIPFLVILNKANGKTLCSRNIRTPQLPVIDYILQDTIIYLLTQNEVLTYSMGCNFIGKLSASPDSMTTKESGRFLSFIKKTALANIYFKTPEKSTQFKPLTTLLDEGVVYFLITEKGLVGFDDKMQKRSWLPEKDYSFCQSRFETKCLLGSTKEYETNKILIDEKNNGEVLFHLKIHNRSEIENEHLIIYTSSNKVSVLPLSTLCNH